MHTVLATPERFFVDLDWLMARGLTLKQERFLAAYIGESNGNATDAARKAGYHGSDDTLRQVGSQNLTNPHIAAAIAEHKAAIRAEGIGNRQNRIDRLNDHWQRMQRLVEARAAAATGEAPGDAEGLMARQVKAVGAGGNQRLVVEYVFDAALERELRAHEEQAAKELGQWEERSHAVLEADKTFVELARAFMLGNESSASGDE